jgi:hypothetical protein
MREDTERSENVGNQLWFMLRVITGYLVHLMLIIGTLAYTELVVELAGTIRDTHIHPVLLKFLVAIIAFASGMAGTFWVKSMYLQHVLPEALDDITKKILGR